MGSGSTAPLIVTYMGSGGIAPLIVKYMRSGGTAPLIVTSAVCRSVVSFKPLLPYHWEKISR